MDELDPQPDMKPFQIEGSQMHGFWHNERRRWRKTGMGPMLITWKEPSPGMIPSLIDGRWVWTKDPVLRQSCARPENHEGIQVDMNRESSDEKR